MLAMASSFRSPACSISPREGRRALLEVVGPLLVHLHQALEVVLVAVRLVDDQLAFFLGGGVGGRLLLGRVGRLGGQVRVFVLQLQHRVLLDLLLDALFQGQDRQLQNLHRLDHPRRQHLLLHQSKVLSEG